MAEQDKATLMAYLDVSWPTEENGRGFGVGGGGRGCIGVPGGKGGLTPPLRSRPRISARSKYSSR